MRKYVLYEMLYRVKKKITRKKERKENDVCIFLHSRTFIVKIIVIKKKKLVLKQIQKSRSRGNTIDQLFEFRIKLRDQKIKKKRNKYSCLILDKKKKEKKGEI